MSNATKIQKLEDLKVWCKARDLGKYVYQATSKVPFCKAFPLRDQVRRAAISISSNIAEGFGRYNAGEFRNFLSIASGSTTEVKSQIYLAKEVGYIGGEEAQRLIQLCDEITRMIGGMRGKIKASNGNRRK